MVQKILIVALVIALVWFGFKALARIKASNEAKAKEGGTDSQE
jgi:hypothetical protein